MADFFATDVVVIGSGCAGLAAAVRLSAAGKRVVLAEEAPRLGGRATAFTDRESGERVDNGQHVLFGCYHSTYSLLREIGSAERAPLQPAMSIAMAGSDGRVSTLRCPRLPPPWHLLAGVMAWRALSLPDRMSVLRLRPLLARVRRSGAAEAARLVNPAMTVAEWLHVHGQSARIVQWLWEPLAIAALNQSTAVAAAAPFVRVLGELFGPRAEDSAVGLPNVPLDELIARPAAAFIEANRGRVLLRAPATLHMAGDRIEYVRMGNTIIRAAAVVSAVPWHAMPRLWDGDVPPLMAPTVADAMAMGSVPIVTVNLWFDRPVWPATVTSPFIGYVGGTAQWFFDKRRLFGGQANHVAAVVSGASDLVRRETADIVSLIERDARVVFGSANGATIARSLVVREPRATFSVAPGGPPRPSTHTRVANFYLAGDWTQTGLPGTIEGAVQSGFAAAQAVINAAGSPKT